MNRVLLKNLGLAAIVIAVGVGAFFALVGGSDERPVPADRATLRARRIAEASAARKRMKTRSARQEVRVDSSAAEAARAARLEDEEDENKLNELAKKVLADLQKALDRNDFKSVQALIARAFAYKRKELGGSSTDGIPILLKKRMIEALEWFGAAGVPEILDFVADANPEVNEMAIDAYEDALSDISLGDRERAQLVIAAAKVLTDADALDSILMEILSMRPSVIASTVLEIQSMGTDVAKATLAEELEFLTEDGVKTPDDVRRWLQENPDDEDAEALYGPSK